MKRKILTMVATLGVSAIVLSGCGGGGGDSEANGGDSGGSGSSTDWQGTPPPETYQGADGGEVTLVHCQPQDDLIPGNTQETCGGDVLDGLFKGLTEVDPATGKARLANAESIKANDDQTKFTVKLKDWTFTDGTPVTAESYTKAWSYVASGANGQKQQAFFGPGFLDVKGYDKVSKSKDKDAQLPGLKVVDDSTFEVTTTNANSLFETMLVHTPYVPLPEAFFKDPEKFGKKPIGDGPFKLDSYTPEQEIVVSKNADYKGEEPAHVDKINFKIYTDTAAGYADLVASNADYSNAMPADAVAGNKWQTDLGDGRWMQGPSPTWSGFSFPMYDDKFKDPKLRHAISMAIDRQAVSDVVTEGSFPASKEFSPPGIEPYIENTCGEYCETNADEAKKLLEEAGGFDGTLTIAYNADGEGNKQMAEATCTSINENLGIDCQGQSFPTFAEMLDKIDAHKMTGMYRSAWQADYPSPLSYLTAYYVTDAGSNESGYSNKTVDELTAKVLTQDDAGREDSFKKIQEQIKEDMPLTPLWTRATQFGWSDKVVAPRVTWKGTIDLTSIGLKK